MEKHELKNTMNERELQRVYKFNINPRHSNIITDKRFVNIDKGSQGSTHCICFIVKVNKFYYFDSFGGQPDKFLLNQSPKPIMYHSYKI